MSTWHEEQQHDNIMARIIEETEFALFALLKPKIIKDGDKWCCLYGDNLQDGIAGFGDSPYLAIMEWRKEWYLKINPKEGGER